MGPSEEMPPSETPPGAAVVSVCAQVGDLGVGRRLEITYVPPTPATGSAEVALTYGTPTRGVAVYDLCWAFEQGTNSSDHVLVGSLTVAGPYDVYAIAAPGRHTRRTRRREMAGAITLHKHRQSTTPRRYGAFDRIPLG